MTLHRALHALPCSITLSSVFFGLLSIVLATTQPYQAAICILFASLCDMADGKVARLTRTQSEFGTQLDSLADIVSFGMAPAILVYQWGLTSLTWGPVDVGLVVAFVYLCGGALRLARFNVQAQASEGASAKSTKFTGLAIPAAAMAVVGLVMAQVETGAAFLRSHGVVIPTVLLLAALMVSEVRYEAFKAFRSHKSRFLFYGLIVLGLTLLVLRSYAGVVLLAFTGSYVLLGLGAAALRLPNRLARARR